MANLKCGGQTETLKGRISEIRFKSSDTTPTGFELWIVDSEGSESLTYLSADESLILLEEIKQGIKAKFSR